MHKIMKLIGTILLLGVTLLIILMCFDVYAQDYIIPTQGSVNASISDKGVNRIAIANDRITQVIGNEDEYIIESDANLGQIFLTPMLKDPQSISIRLVTEREKIIDMKFKIKKIDPQTINLKYKDNTISTAPNQGSNPNFINTSFSNNQMSGNTETQQVIDNLKLVYSSKLHGEKLKTIGCLKQNKNLRNLKLVEATQYSLNRQVIVKAVISNPKKEEILLKEIDFSNCMGIVKAVSLGANRLAQGTHTTIYVVGQDGK